MTKFVGLWKNLKLANGLKCVLNSILYLHQYFSVSLLPSNVLFDHLKYLSIQNVIGKGCYILAHYLVNLEGLSAGLPIYNGIVNILFLEAVTNSRSASWMGTKLGSILPCHRRNFFRAREVREVVMSFNDITKTSNFFSVKNPHMIWLCTHLLLPLLQFQIWHGDAWHMWSYNCGWIISKSLPDLNQGLRMSKMLFRPSWTPTKSNHHQN